MTTETKEQLEELAKTRLNDAIRSDIFDEEYDGTAFKEGMEAIEKLSKLEQQENEKDIKRRQLDCDTSMKKEQMDYELSQKNADRKVSWKDIVGWGLKVVEMAAIPVAIAVLNMKHDEKQLDKINQFESDGNIYTGTGGRSVGKDINWK